MSSLAGKAAQRWLEWPELLNARDLGGLPTTEGLTLPRRIVRSDDLGRLNAAGQQALIEYGIETIIDLRRPAELREAPPPLADHPGYLNVPFLDEAIAADREFETVAETYIWLLDRMAHRVAAIMQAIASAPEGGVLVHCYAGKDRTGLIVALLLALAGVSRDEIVTDYALSDPAAPSRPAPLLPSGWSATPRDHRFPCHPETMVTVFDHLDARRQGVTGYLKAIGVDAATQTRLGERLTIRDLPRRRQSDGPPACSEHVRRA